MGPPAPPSKATATLLERLRTDINSSDGRGVSDGSLVCTALLAVFELTINDISETRQKDVFAHWSGLSALFLAKQRNRRLSDGARAIWYDFWVIPFGVPVSLSIPSPFDGERWLDLETDTQRSSNPTGTARSQSLTNQLFVRLPLSICNARALREARYGNEETVYIITELARDLSDLRDLEAESALLRRAKVQQTQDTSQRDIVPYPLRFPTVCDLRCGLLYWFSRMMTINCCVRILQLHPDAASRLNAETLQREKTRHYVNVMMCWEQAFAFGPFATLWVAKGLPQSWQQLRSSSSWRGMSSAKVVEWVLERMKHPLIGWYTGAFGEEDFDLAADLLVGGPSRGFIASATNRRTQVSTITPVALITHAPIQATTIDHSLKRQPVR